MTVDNHNKSRKLILQKSDKKRKDQPKFNAIRNVPEESIIKLESLAKRFGNKKIATLKAIDFLYEETFNKS